MITKARLRTLVLPLLAVLLAACSSAPEAPGPDDCLIVILSEKRNTSSYTGLGRQYFLEFNNDVPPVFMKQGYIAFTIREPGTSIIAITSKVSGRGSGDKTSQKVEVMLPYNPGKVIIMPFVFEQLTESVGGGMVTSNAKFRKLEDHEKVDLERQLEKDSIYTTWQK